MNGRKDGKKERSVALSSLYLAYGREEESKLVVDFTLFSVWSESMKACVDREDLVQLGSAKAMYYLLVAVYTLGQAGVVYES